MSGIIKLPDYDVSFNMMSSTELVYPYAWYPGTPCAGYSNTNHYNTELKRLATDMWDTYMILSARIYLHFSFGAAMNEFMSNDYTYDESIKPHYQQLLPFHFRKFLENGGEIMHYIISPNSDFEDDQFKIPIFITETPEYEWKRTNKTFQSKIYKITVKIFCTMMPTIDKTNETKFKKINDLFGGTCDNEILKIYEQTSDDRIYTQYFYENMKMLINKTNILNGLVSGFSFAVFREDSDKAYINNYALFPEIKKCFQDKNILGEWTYNNTNYLMKLTNGIKISYSNKLEDKSYLLDIKNYEFTYLNKKNMSPCTYKLKDIDIDIYINIIRKTFYDNIYEECKINENIIECSYKYIEDRILKKTNYILFKQLLIYILQNKIDTQIVNYYILTLNWIKKLELQNSEKIDYYYDTMLLTQSEINNKFGYASDVCNFGKIEYLALSYILGNSIIVQIGYDLLKIKHNDCMGKLSIKI
jgi:hypothetical protein